MTNRQKFGAVLAGIFSIGRIPLGWTLALWLYHSNHGASTLSAYTMLVLFMIVAVTDTLDGRTARYFKAETKFGAFIDPLADKLVMLPLLVVTADWLWQDYPAPDDWIIFPLMIYTLFCVFRIVQDVASFAYSFVPSSTGANSHGKNKTLFDMAVCLAVFAGQVVYSYGSFNRGYLSIPLIIGLGFALCEAHRSLTAKDLAWQTHKRQRGQRSGLLISWGDMDPEFEQFFPPVGDSRP